MARDDWGMALGMSAKRWLKVIAVCNESGLKTSQKMTSILDDDPLCVKGCVAERREMTRSVFNASVAYASDASSDAKQEM